MSKIRILKSHLKRRMDSLESQLEIDETNEDADARLEELVRVMDLMDWDIR